MENVSTNQSLDKLTFNRLTRLYMLALSAIAFSIVISHVIIDYQISNQKKDSYLINISGRQRMLSQKLSKETFLFKDEEDLVQRNFYVTSLKQTLNLWSESHKILMDNENSGVVKQLFRMLNPYFENMQESAFQLISAVERNPNIETISLKEYIADIKANESHFLVLMDRIVKQYEVEATEKVDQLRYIEFVIFLITIIILLLEFFFVFNPAASTVEEVILKLLIAEKKAVKMAYDADLMCEAKDKSVKELRTLNYAMDQTLLFCRISTTGEVIHMGDKFSNLLQVNAFSVNTKFSHLLTNSTEERKTIDDLIAEKNKSGWQGELIITNKSGNPMWLEMTLIPVSVAENKSEVLIICLNITERRMAQKEVERLNRERFENEMNQQKILSSKIVENQENEQNRIAREIHDGIGQMLTGLKFSLESIDLSNHEKSEEKIIYLKKLTEDIIKGVRTATFNLMPPEIKDHGISSSLQRLTKELSKLTGKNILFINKTDFNQRLDSLIEINIYRVTQEAINNAIKYADSTHIVVMISHSESLLSVTIDDNGKGFDPSEVGTKKSSESGMGLEFMQERIKYIKGRLFLHSIKGEGTHITLNVPLTISA